MKSKIMLMLLLSLTVIITIANAEETNDQTINGMWVGRWGEFTVYLGEDRNPYWFKKSVCDEESLKWFYATALTCYLNKAPFNVEWEYDVDGTTRVVRTISPRL